MTELEKYEWARRNQGYEGTYEEWQALPVDEREQYELGAQGIGTE